MTRSEIYAIGSVILTIALWGVVLYGVLDVQARAQSQALEAQQRLTKKNQETLNRNVSSLITRTEKDRARLESVVGADPVAIISVIEAAGWSAGITSKVTDGVAESPRELIDKETIRPIVFSVQGTGSLEDVLQAVRLYEQLPYPSTVDSIEITREVASAGTWRLSARIRVFTTSAGTI